MTGNIIRLNVTGNVNCTEIPTQYPWATNIRFSSRLNWGTGDFSDVDSSGPYRSLSVIVFTSLQELPPNGVGVCSGVDVVWGLLRTVADQECGYTGAFSDVALGR